MLMGISTSNHSAAPSARRVLLQSRAETAMRRNVARATGSGSVIPATKPSQANPISQSTIHLLMPQLLYLVHVVRATSGLNLW